MIENEVDIVTILDENANVLFESPALKRILGYSPEELIGKSVFDFIHPADSARVQKALRGHPCHARTVGPIGIPFPSRASRVWGG